MTIPAGLLAALVTRPDERDAYLVAGDWLSAQGHPWGEFISAQVRLQGEHDAERFLALRRRSEELLRAHAATWLGAPELDVQWRWGFVERLTLPDPSLLAPVLQSEAGRLARALVLAGAPQQLAAALTTLEQARLPRLDALELTSTRASAAVRLTTTLALRRLHLAGLAFDWHALPPALVELSVRDLVDPPLGAWLAQAPDGLEHLELLEVDAPHKALRAAVDRQRRLRALHLEDDLPDELAQWLAQSPALATLEHLALGGPATDTALDAIVTHFARFARLQTLVLYGGRFGTTLRRHAHRALPRLVFAQRRPTGDWTKARARRE